MASPATYDVDFKYSNCDWVCEISNVEAKTLVLVGASPRTNYVAITQASDVPCTPPSEPLLAKSDLTDPNLNDDKGSPLTKYWIYHANIAHEEAHRSDWKGFYEPKLNNAIDWCELLYRDIDCGDSSANTCQGAKSFWQSSINDAFQDAWDLACEDYDDSGTSLNEADQRAYLVQYFIQQPVADELPGGCGP